jgi:hypothetical protein
MGVCCAHKNKFSKCLSQDEILDIVKEELKIQSDKYVKLSLALVKDLSEAEKNKNDNKLNELKGKRKEEVACLEKYLKGLKLVENSFENKVYSNFGDLKEILEKYYEFANKNDKETINELTTSISEWLKKN